MATGARAPHRLLGVSEHLRPTAPMEPAAGSSPDGWREDACGVALSGAAIPLLARAGAADDAHHLLLLVPQEHLDAVVAAADSMLPPATAVSVAGVQSSWLDDPAFPPDNPPVLRFHDADQPEARYLWRWAGFAGVDTIVQLELTGGAGEPVWKANRAVPGAVASALAATPTLNGLLSSIGAPAGPPAGAPNGLEVIPGLHLTAGDPITAIGGVAQLLALGGLAVPSPSHAALVARAARTPLDVAAVLATAYGHSLDGPQPHPETGELVGGVGYVQGVGISGRLRLAALAGGTEETAQSVAALVEEYASGAAPLWTEPALLPGSAGPTMAALVWCGELAEATGDSRYTDLLMDAASKYTVGEPVGAERKRAHLSHLNMKFDELAKTRSGQT